MNEIPDINWRLMSIGYILCFGGLLGLHTNDNIPVIFWLILVFFGGILIAIKHEKLKKRGKKLYYKLLFVDVISCLFAAIIPYLYKNRVSNFAGFNFITSLIYIFITTPAICYNYELLRKLK